MNRQLDAVNFPDGGSQTEQPKWRQDFPIDRQEDDYIARRDFTRFMVLTSLAFAVGQIWILAQNFWHKRNGPMPRIKITEVDAMPVGGSLVFAYPDENSPCVLVRMDAQTFVAYDQQCTHLTCPVIPEPTANRLYCPCHHGVFDLATGRPLAGPPRRPLPRIRLEMNNHAIYAIGIEENAI